jgi:hypothetical protein
MLLPATLLALLVSASPDATAPEVPAAAEADAPAALVPAVVPPEEPDPVYPWSSSRSLIFGHVVERSGFHFQAVFGIGGGPDNEGIFHAMEIGGTFKNGITLAMLHTFTQNKGVMGPDRGPDLIGGWMLEVKAPVFFPEFEVKFAAGLGGLHDQSDGIKAIPGFGIAWGVDFHVPFFRNSGLTLGTTGIMAWVNTVLYFTFGVGLGYTFF